MSPPERLTQGPSADAAVAERIGELLKDLLSEIAGIERSVITPDASIDGVLAMESVTLMAVHSAIQDQLDIELDPVEIIEHNSFRLIVEYLVRRVQTRA